MWSWIVFQDFYTAASAVLRRKGISVNHYRRFRMKLEEVGSDSSYLKEDHAALLKPSYSYFDGGEGENLWF